MSWSDSVTGRTRFATKKASAAHHSTDLMRCFRRQAETRVDKNERAMEKLTTLAAHIRGGNDQGATVVEYSLLAAIIIGICVVAVAGLGHQLSTMLAAIHIF
ncbi:hypothetical protein Areg01_03930 [Actinoplanes regularis]|nr:hypothetical protein Areg01_03930 [Actinoplanes regularis]